MVVAYVLVGLYWWAMGTLLVRWGLRSWRRQESFASRLRGLPLTDAAKLGSLGRLTPASPRTTQMRVDIIVLLILLVAVVVAGWTVISISWLNRPRWLIAPHLRGHRPAVSWPSASSSQIVALPEWPPPTIAVLATIDRDGPHAIPVSAPVRGRPQNPAQPVPHRGSLRRLRESPQVALVILAAGNSAFTARERARVLQQPMAVTPDYAGIAIDVEQIEDHRQPAFVPNDARRGAGVGDLAASRRCMAGCARALRR